eukprot:GCRY01005159.1.p1 GENE.GCRY01005159.1~~GCRY01005159.1.p1  ORF type:complete len:260 (-),score=21.90 GCRY01005159.1:257-1036(-)
MSQKKQFNHSKLLKRALQDICSRFVVNAPDEEYQSFERLFGQIEQAHWFYTDFYRAKNPSFPAYSLKAFGEQIFHFSPILKEHEDDYYNYFLEYLKHKKSADVYGGVLLNPTMTKCIIVKGFAKHSSWSFPRGKIDYEEEPHDCAIREVQEEIGFDITSRLKRSHYVETVFCEHKTRLYMIENVLETTLFQPQTRQEISRIEWAVIDELPAQRGKHHPYRGRYFMVIPFVRCVRIVIFVLVIAQMLSASFLNQSQPNTK